MLLNNSRASLAALCAAALVFASLATPGQPASAAIGNPSAQYVAAPNLGTAANFGVLGEMVTNSKAKSVIVGDVGMTGPGEIAWPDGSATVTGTIHHEANSITAQAGADAAAAWQYVNNLPHDGDTGTLSGDLNGDTITAGLWFSAGAVTVAAAGTLTFDAEGDPDAVFIVQVGAAMSFGAAALTQLTNGAQAENIYWVTLGAITVGAGADFEGTILSVGAITVGDGATLEGHVLAVSEAYPSPAAAVTVSNMNPELVAAFSVSQSDGLEFVGEGQAVVFSIKIKNIGQTEITGRFTEDISGLLDDATYNNDFTGGATRAGNVFSWQKVMAEGEEVNLTFSLTTTVYGTGDGLLTNPLIAGTNGQCDTTIGCSNVTTILRYNVSTVASESIAEETTTVDYTVTIRNVGETDYDATHPATFSDELAGLLDDAIYNDDAVDQNGDTTGLTLTGSKLEWAGLLPVGDWRTFAFTATVDAPDTGDRNIHTAVSPGPTGLCDLAIGCTTSTLVPHIPTFTISKSVDTASTVEGATVTSVVTVTNTGLVDFTNVRPASFSENLSGVLDDAIFTGSDGATLAGSTLSWSGALPVGQHITITSTVRVNVPDTGDRALTSTATAGLYGTCAGTCSTTTTVAVPIVITPPVTPAAIAPTLKLAVTGIDSAGAVRLMIFLLLTGLVMTGFSLLVLRRRCKI